MPRLWKFYYSMIYGILGHPVAHSLSPQMQSSAFDFYGIKHKFLRFDVQPKDLKNFIKKVRKEKIQGLAVTIPHKENIIEFLDEISEEAKSIGAVNTVYWEKDQLCGTNTDGSGFFEALIKNTEIQNKKEVAVFGAGGSSRAIVCYLKKNNFNVSIFNRNVNRAKDLANEFSVNFDIFDNFNSSRFDFLVNTTSVGMNEDKSIISKNQINGFEGVVFDIVFSPLITKLLKLAKENNNEIITGEKMLLHQGVKQFELWTGKKAPIEIMQNALIKNIS